MLLAAIQSPPSDIGTAGSPVWQTVFFSFALILILFEIVRGWRLGIMRQLMRVAAVAAAYAAAYFAGDLLVPLLRSTLKMPDIVISLPARVILAMIVYGIIASLGSILFKRTAQQSSGAVRLVYGLSGAAVGLCFGIFFTWLFLVGIRMAGSIADTQVQAQAKSGNLPAQSRPPNDVALKPEFNADTLMTLLARLKNSVELGSAGDVVKRTGAMPTGELQTLSEMGAVLANPEAAAKFFNSPGARELSEHPKIVALRTDPEIAEMIAQRRLIELLRHPRVLDTVNDPELAARIKQFDLKKALEHASKKN